MKNHVKHRVQKDGSMDIPLPEPDIKITYQYRGELLWMKSR